MPTRWWTVLSAVGGIKEATSAMTEGIVCMSFDVQHFLISNWNYYFVWYNFVAVLLSNLFDALSSRTDRIVWISVSIPVCLFMVQRFGTDKVGYSFAPIICVWLALIGSIGLYNFFKFGPGVIRAINPVYIVEYFRRNGKEGWISLGGIVLAITGHRSKLCDISNALCLAHVSRPVIGFDHPPSFRLTNIFICIECRNWSFICRCWSLNCSVDSNKHVLCNVSSFSISVHGDRLRSSGATTILFLMHSSSPSQVKELTASPTFWWHPRWSNVSYSFLDPLYRPMFVVAVLAAIIASQAMISGTFSIIQQSLSLGCFPRVKIVHTSAKYEGQVYIPEINYLLMLACVCVTLGFRTTEKIGNAYGNEPTEFQWRFD